MNVDRHVSDYNKSSSEIVLDLINASNGTKFTPESSVIGKPVEVDGIRTKIVFQSLNKVHVGAVSLWYNRVPLKDVISSGEQTDSIMTWIGNYSEVVKELNFRHGINLQDTDILIDGREITEDFTQSVGTTRVLNITAKPDSLVWHGSVSVELLFGSVPYSDRPENTYVEITDRREIRASTDGAIRVFVL